MNKCKSDRCSNEVDTFYYCDDHFKIEEESSMLRTRPESVADKVKELRDLADKMMRQGAPYCVDIHALAVDISEGLNLEEESNEKL